MQKLTIFIHNLLKYDEWDTYQTIFHSVCEVTEVNLLVLDMYGIPTFEKCSWEVDDQVDVHLKLFHNPYMYEPTQWKWRANAIIHVSALLLS